MNDEAITQKIIERNISEILHFTTNNGLLGILATGSLLAHSELPSEKRLSHILQINCPDRSRDREWHSYVNLSIERINGSFFRIAKNKWHAHRDIFWCILSFSPEIMAHAGVMFSTTNNAYDFTERAPGEQGLEALFAPSVRLFQNKWATRSKASQSNLTTCNQAEVLYPRALPIQYLRRVYLSSDANLHEVQAQLGIFYPDIGENLELIVAPHLFE